MANEATVQRPEQHLLFTRLACREPELVAVDVDPVLRLARASGTAAAPTLTPDSAAPGTPGGPAGISVTAPRPRTSGTSVARLRSRTRPTRWCRQSQARRLRRGARRSRGTGSPSRSIGESLRRSARDCRRWGGRGHRRRWGGGGHGRVARRWGRGSNEG